MAVRFPLKMSDGTLVRTIEELKEHFDLKAVLGYYSNGRLVNWLEDRYYTEETAKVRDLDASSDEFKQKLCEILGVSYLENADKELDIRNIMQKNERYELLKRYTIDDKILSLVDDIAFTQEELDALVERLGTLAMNDDGNRVIYLCGEHFDISGSIRGITYKGINNPTVKFNHDIIEDGIDLQDLEFDIGDYINDSHHGAFFNFFKNNLKLGIKLLQMAAEKGSAEAQFLLGDCYMKGKGVNKNIEEAAMWFQKAAGNGHVDANVVIYALFYIGLNGENAQKAAEWFRKASEQDSVYASLAQGRLGELYIFGRGVEQDWYEAVKWLKKAVKNDNIDAITQFYLGTCYHDGKGTEQSDEEAAKWFQKAAEKGYSDAQYMLGKYYSDGIGVEQNEKKAMKWFRKAAEKGSAEAQLRLGAYFLDDECEEFNVEEAVKWYRKAAEQDVAEAQFMLGGCYACGIGVESNFLEAVKWRRRAVEQGFGGVQYLDVCFDNFMESDEELVECYQKASVQNDVEAQNYLGLCYEEGRGVEVDTDEAREWYAKAAKQGNIEAQAGLNRCDALLLI